LIIGSLAALVILFGVLLGHPAFPCHPAAAERTGPGSKRNPAGHSVYLDLRQLLLILPFSVVILAMDRMGAHFLLSASVILAVDVLVVILLFFNVILQVEILNVAVPLVVFSLCLWYLTRRNPVVV